jgi:dipeptidyl aminopeptidase/acylaminoacyl peptidase
MRNTKNLKGFALILVVLFVGIAGLVYFLLGNRGESTKVNPVIENIVKEVAVQMPTPTPFEFQELTIPYLRNRSYESRLGDLQKDSENDNYTSYVTSYDSDGLKIFGLLTQPKGVKPNDGWPAIVFLHGYIPPQNYQTTVNYASYVDYLARNGFVVFKIDYRGHGNSEGEPGGGYYSGDYVIDTLNAVTALGNTDFVDPTKIGLWGHSMSGNVVLRAFAVAKDIPAVVIWAGAGYTYTDLSEYRIQDDSYQPPPSDSERAKKRQELRDAYGNFDPNHWFWKQVPATNYLDGVIGAVQINHAINDNVVSIDYSRNLMRILDSTQITRELKEYPSGGHNITGSTFNEAMQNTVEFFERYLSN